MVIESKYGVRCKEVDQEQNLVIVREMLLSVWSTPSSVRNTLFNYMLGQGTSDLLPFIVYSMATVCGVL